MSCALWEGAESERVPVRHRIQAYGDFLAAGDRLRAAAQRARTRGALNSNTACLSCRHRCSASESVNAANGSSVDSSATGLRLRRRRC